MVSVVDAATFLDRFEVLEELHDMGVGRDEDDDRSVTDLLVDQIEFANVLVISKPDLVDAEKLERVVATVRQLNPEAQLVVAEKGDLPLDAVLDTGLFDEEEGEVNPGWVQALNDEPTPETEEYGITSFVYRHRWPFHPKRLAKALEGDWSGVLRSKGFFWLATRPDVQAMWSQAGLSATLEPLAMWFAAVPEEDWDLETQEERDELTSRWDPVVGDRQTELVFIGVEMDEADIRERLDHRRVRMVEVWLAGQEVVEIILLAARLPAPGATTEEREPVVRRGAIGLRLDPVKPVCFRVVAALAAFLKPRMLIRAMGRHDIDHHPQPQRVGPRDQRIKVVKSRCRYP